MTDKVQVLQAEKIPGTWGTTRNYVMSGNIALRYGLPLSTISNCLTTMDSAPKPYHIAGRSRIYTIEQIEKWVAKLGGEEQFAARCRTAFTEYAIAHRVTPKKKKPNSRYGKIKAEKQELEKLTASGKFNTAAKAWLSKPLIRRD